MCVLCVCVCACVRVCVFICMEFCRLFELGFLDQLKEILSRLPENKCVMLH